MLQNKKNKEKNNVTKTEMVRLKDFQAFHKHKLVLQPIATKYYLKESKNRSDLIDHMEMDQLFLPVYFIVRTMIFYAREADV